MMKDFLAPYHDHLALVMDTGYKQSNRTDQWAITLPYGVTHTYDLAEGFPAVWSKELYFPGIRGEIIGFLRGYTTSDAFARLGCKWWDADANENQDWLDSPHRAGKNALGKVYGYQWRNWEGENGQNIDQVQVALDLIRNDPYSRRILISAWRPDHFSQMALPPCHVIYRFQVNVEAGELNMSVYQRSSDMFLGVPMNIAGAAIMLELFAAATGLTPRWLTHHLDDTHIYSKAFSAVEEQLQIIRGGEPMPPPFLCFHKELKGLNANELASIEPAEIELIDYKHYSLVAERVPMATTRKGGDAEV